MWKRGYNNGTGKNGSLWAAAGQPAAAAAATTTTWTTRHKLSQSTLHKILYGMLLIVFIIYVILMAILVGFHHQDPTVLTLEQHGHWGPAQGNTHDILRDHLENLMVKQNENEQQQQQQQQQQKFPKISIDSRHIHQDIMLQPKGANKNSEQKRKNHDSEDLEEVEIIEMERPEFKRKEQELRQEQSRKERLQQKHQHDHIEQQQRQPIQQQAENHHHQQQQLLQQHHQRQHPEKQQQQQQPNKLPRERRILTAYLEPIYREDWTKKPLPIRNTTARQLRKVEYPRVNSCRRFLEQFPINDYPNDDPFLPWIHDVFPTEDGKFIQFVAQNKRRCQTGSTPDQIQILDDMQPQIALFQSVPVRRINNKKGMQQRTNNFTRYQLTTYQQADGDGLETRFICQFQPSGQETLSVHNINYDYVAYRKGMKQTFTKEGRIDVKSLHTSQLIFLCPVPSNLVETIQSGKSVIHDWATIFLTLVPIRTPPRYGAPNRFLPPHYQDPKENDFNVAEEYGTNHILPLIEDSGRWENIPICQTSNKAYPESKSLENSKASITGRKLSPTNNNSTSKKHRLIACTWASADYATRGDRFTIRDGERRLDEWIRFHLLVGVEHIYVYDNSKDSSSSSTSSSLQSVTDQFPNRVTRIPWPAQICNNNRSFHDSPGERSSQYAAESSCRLRFGPQSDWLASMDIDEYIVPVGNYTSLLPLLDDLDKEGTKIISFASWRAWPRHDLIEPPVPIDNKTICDEPWPCFEVKVPATRTILQTYNCDRQRVKTEQMPAEKQIYRTDYVMQHFVHFSAVTKLTMWNQEETKQAGFSPHVPVAPDPQSRFANELTEVTMLHTKALATQDTSGWQERCKGLRRGYCRVGRAYPFDDSNATKDAEGWLYNCYVNEKIDNYWVPRLEGSLKGSN